MIHQQTKPRNGTAGSWPEPFNRVIRGAAMMDTLSTSMGQPNFGQLEL
jgi:hypothetical protein